MYEIYKSAVDVNGVKFFVNAQSHNPFNSKSQDGGRMRTFRSDRQPRDRNQGEKHESSRGNWINDTPLQNDGAVPEHNAMDDYQDNDTINGDETNVSEQGKA